MRKSRWNLKLDIATAMRGGEIIPLADSTVLRFIDEFNELIDAEEKVKIIKENIKQARKNKNKCELKKLYHQLNTVQFKPDYMCLIIDNINDYWVAYKRGFKINGIKYSRLLGTTGGVKGETIVFTSEKMKPKLRKRIDNGRNKDVEMIPAKFGAYEALSCSSSIVLSHPNRILVVNDCELDIFEDVIVLDDSCEGEPKIEYKDNFKIHKNASDGFGLMLPWRAARWALELELDYIPSGFNTRGYAFEKGMLVTFDFIDFANKHNTFLTHDAWGKEADIRDYDVILTTSMLKLWDSYSSFDDYMNNCLENNYKFCISKICPDILDNERDLNYQFIQSFRLTDDEIMELISPTINEIKEVLGLDYRKSLLFLKGIGLNEDNVNLFDSDFITALMIDKNMINDPFVQSKIHKMIRKRINEAKTGVIKVSGNFQVACGDPYMLCQSILGLEKTGLLKKGEFYSKYWLDKGVKQVVGFRAPMTCHNNIRKLNIVDNAECSYWYKWIKTMLIFNSWDTTAEAFNGEDYDADQNFSTNNNVLLNNVRDLPTIMCVQKKAPKKVFNEDDLVQANIDSFGDDIGMYTNGITSQFDVQSQFNIDSEEYKVLDYRIMCGQLFQQNAIDKAKGIISKPRPAEWFDYKANKIKDTDTDEIRKKKEFNKKIVADKKPYFMRYIYPQLMNTYNEYIESSNQKCLCEFKLTIQELRDKPNKTKQEYEFLDYYEKRMPVSNNNCIVNKICRIFENEFDGYLKNYKPSDGFDYNILKSNVQYNESLYKTIEKQYTEYCSRVQKYQQQAKKERLNDDDIAEGRSILVRSFKQACNTICPDKDILTNIVIDICYKTNKSKQFAWDICGDQIIKNLLQKNDNIIWYPEESVTGDISYLGKNFIMKSKKLEVVND